MARKLLLIALLAAVLPTAPAAAETRYAWPGAGTTGGCTAGEPPCRLSRALGQAVDGDEVVVKSTATHFLTSGVTVSDDITVRGEEGQPRPLISFNGAAPTVSVPFGATGTTLRDLDLRALHPSAGVALDVRAFDAVVDDVGAESAWRCIDANGNGQTFTDIDAKLTAPGGERCLLLGTTATTVRRVSVTGPVMTNPGSAGMQVGGGSTVEDSTILMRGQGTGVLVGPTGPATATLRRLRVEGGGFGLAAFGSAVLTDSVVTTPGSGGSAISHGQTEGAGLRLRNVTAVATGASARGIEAQADVSGLGPGRVEARNVIARGGADDLSASALCFPAPCAPGALDVAASNFVELGGDGAKTAGPGNQSGDPRFVGPDDLRLADDSPAIDAGVDDLLGPSAFDGAPRVLGAAVDMGAHERAGPPAREVSDPLPPAPPPPPPRDTVAPTLSGVRLVSRTVRRGRALRLRLAADEVATLRFRVLRTVRGRRRAGRCRTAARRGRRCTVRRVVKRLQGRTAGPAATLRVRVGRLRPGRSTLEIRAVDVAGNVSRPVRLSFRVVRAKRRS